MKSAALSFCESIEKFNRWIGSKVSWLVVFMVVLTFVIAVLRYVFHLGWVWLQETVLYLHGILFLTAMAPTLLKDEHVRVDLFYRNRSLRGKAWVNLGGSLFLLAPMVVLIFYHALPYVADSWAVLEGSKDGGGLEAVYLQKTMILAFCVFTFLQGMALTIRSAFTLLENERLSR